MVILFHIIQLQPWKEIASLVYTLTEKIVSTTAVQVAGVKQKIFQKARLGTWTARLQMMPQPIQNLMCLSGQRTLPFRRIAKRTAPRLSLRASGDYMPISVIRATRTSVEVFDYEEQNSMWWRQQGGWLAALAGK